MEIALFCFSHRMHAASSGEAHSVNVAELRGLWAPNERLMEIHWNPIPPSLLLVAFSEHSTAVPCQNRRRHMVDHWSGPRSVNDMLGQNGFETNKSLSRVGNRLVLLTRKFCQCKSHCDRNQRGSFYVHAGFICMCRVALFVSGNGFICVNGKTCYQEAAKFQPLPYYSRTLGGKKSLLEWKMGDNKTSQVETHSRPLILEIRRNLGASVETREIKSSYWWKGLIIYLNKNCTQQPYDCVQTR